MRNLTHRSKWQHGMRALFLVSLGLILCPLLGSYAYPQETGDVPFCQPIDFSQVQSDGFDAADKRAFSLNKGNPRTVRVIYFVPNDRSFSSTVEDSIRRAMLQVQAFFAEQMNAHGFGLNAINIEAGNDGEPLIHRVTGQHADDHYADGTHFAVFKEIRENYDTQANIYIAFIDNSRRLTPRGGRNGKTGGEASLGLDFDWQTVGHELGHGFGLHHDFRNDSYIMSYGDKPDGLSALAAYFLSVHPYFNAGISAEWTASPTVDLISSPKFPPNADSISVKFKVADTDGLHQLILFTPTPPLNWGSGYPEVKAWRGLAKRQNSEVELEYRRDIVSTTATPANPAPEEIHVNAVDTNGNVSQVSYNLVSISPYGYATLEGHADGVVSVSFSPAAGILASASYDNTIRLWDVATGTTISTLNHTRNVTSVSFSPDGSTLASGSSDGNVRLWAVATGEHVATLEGHVGEVWTLAFSLDGLMLASGSYDNTVRLWNVGTGRAISTLVGHTDRVLSVLFSPDGQILASRSGDDSIRLWDVASGASLATLAHTHHISSMSFTPEGSKLASGSHENTIRLWDVLTGEHTDTLEGHTDDVSTVSFSPDGKILASGSDDNTVRLWRVDTGKVITTLVGHTSGVDRLLFSPDGTILASTSRDKSVRIWNVASGESFATLLHSRTVNSVSFSSDGRFLASGSDDKSVELWDMSAWKLPRAHTVTVVSGDNQEGTAGTELPNPLIVEVRDQFGELLPGAQVTFTVIAGDGGFSSGFTTVNATTGPDGRVHVLLTLGSNPGPNTVRASITDLQVETFNAVGLGSAGETDDAFDYPTLNLPTGAALRLGKGAIGKSQRAVAFSPGGKHLAVASGLGVWLYPVGAPERVTLLPSRIVNSVSFSPDGKTLASGAGDGYEVKGEIRLWDVATGTHTSIVRTNGWVKYVSFSPNGRKLAFGSSGPSIELWDVEAARHDATLEGVTSLGTSVAFSPDGQKIASGREDGSIELWEVGTRSNTTILEGHRREVYSVAFSPDGNTLASASVDRTVRLWDVATGLLSATLRDHYCDVASVAFSPDGSTLASGAFNGDIKFWQTATGRNIATFDDHGDLVRSVSFSPDGTTLASASEDGTVKLWELGTGNATTIVGYSDPIVGMEFSPDGATLVSLSRTFMGKFDIWDVTTGQMIVTLGEHRNSRIESVSFSPDGTTLATGSWTRIVRLWNLETRSNFATLEHDHEALLVSYSPDGMTLATGDWQGMAHLWNVNTEEKIRTLTGLNGYVETLRFSPDGAILATGTSAGVVRLWDVATGAIIQDLKGHSRAVFSMFFSLDGASLATGSYQGTVKLWDLATGKLRTTLLEEVFECMAFSPDGTLFATGSQDNRVRLYDLSTGDIIATLEGQYQNITSVSFTPDGKTLASGSHDGTILLWDLQSLHSVPHVVKGVSGIEQKAPAGTALAQPFVVSVRDKEWETFRRRRCHVRGYRRWRHAFGNHGHDRRQWKRRHDPDVGNPAGNKHRCSNGSRIWSR